MVIPVSVVPAHSRKEALKPHQQAMEKVYDGFARSGLSADERGRLSAVEGDWSRARELRGLLKAEGTVIASGEASGAVIASAGAHQQELEKVQQDLQERLEAESAKTRERLNSHQGYAPLTIFEDGGDIHVQLQWSDRGVDYSLQRPLGKTFFDLCAEPVGAARPENQTFLRADVAEGSTEMQLSPAGESLRVSRVADFGSELIQHERERSGLERLTDFQQQFASQVLTSLGLGWPVLAACAHCH